MYQVKRVEAQSLLSDMKRFAFEQSPGFEDGVMSGYEVAKTFYHNDPRPAEIAHFMGKELCKSRFEFITYRLLPKKRKPAYCYSLSAGMERTIPGIPAALIDVIPDATRELYDDFEEVDEGALCETSKMTLETSDHELREITVNSTYGLEYAGDCIFEASTESILYPDIFTAMQVPPEESDDELSTIYLPERIQQEQLEAVDNIVNNVAFWHVVEPLSMSMEVDSYRKAATAMRGIVHALRTGEVV